MKTETWGDTPQSEILRQTLARERTYFVPSGPLIETPAEPTKPMDKPTETAPVQNVPVAISDKAAAAKSYWDKMTAEQRSAEGRRRRSKWAEKPAVNPTLAEQATAKLQRQYEAQTTPKRGKCACKPKSAEKPANPFNPGFVERLADASRRIRAELDKQRPSGDLGNLRAEYQRRITMIDQVESWMRE